jgi:hypothetical protein
MTDRQLLELAAKAAGLKEWGWMADTLTHVVNNQFVFWEPLTDDGDALRLAVKLHLNVFVGREATGVNDGEVPLRKFPNAIEAHNNDPYAATRRAIVRAAAEIGMGLR